MAENNVNSPIDDIDEYEAEQRRLFQQAVAEFRGGKGEILVEDQSKKDNDESNVKFS